MARVTLQRDVAFRRSWARWARADLRLGPLSPEDPRPRMALAHLAALAAALVIMALDAPHAPTGGRLVSTFGVVIGLSALRTLSVQRRLGLSTLALDAVATVILLAATGAPASPLNVLALAGVWWAAHVPRPHSGLAYGLAFTAAYALLILPQALREHALPEAFENGVAVIVVAVLSDWFVRVDRRALELNEALQAPPFAAGKVAVRHGLQLALPAMEIPIDVVLAAGRVGLTAIQAELLSYLVMGLANQQIADATGFSEAAVRYRLTRLYRALGVRGRRQAAERARELGMSAQRRPRPNYLNSPL